MKIPTSLFGGERKSTPTVLFFIVCMGLCLALVGASAVLAGTDAAQTASPAAGSLWTWCLDNETAILAGLLAFSEVLARIPSVKANSIFELIVGAIKVVANGKQEAPPAA